MDNNPEAPSEQPVQPTVITPTTEPAETPIEQPVAQVVSPDVAPATPAIAEPTQPIITSPSPDLASVPETPPVVPTSSKSKLPLIGGAVAALIVLVAGAYFALIVPNSPTHLYSTGLSRSGKALTMLVDKATAQKQLQAYTSSQLDGSFSVKMGGQTYAGSIGSRYDKASSDSTVSYSGATSQAITLKVLTNLAKNAKYPDIYFNLSGMKALGLTDLMPSLSAYDGKWISVSSSYIESLVKQSGDTGSTSNTFNFTADDAASLAKIATSKTSEYVLTSDKTKAVFEMDKFVGKETTNGITADRYQVSLNQSHLSAYCVDLSNSILSSNAYKHLAGNPDAKTIADQKQSTTKDCKKTPTGSAKTSYDLWINTKTKLIYKLRVSDVKDKNTYVEIGQTYSSGSVLPAFANFHSDNGKYDAKLTMTSDLDKSTTTAHLTATMTSSQPATVTADLSFKPYSGAVKITVPANAIPIEQVLKAFGIGGSPNYSATGTGSVSQQSANLNATTGQTPNLSSLFQNLHF
jgi:hypothetical protein